MAAVNSVGLQCYNLRSQEAQHKQCFIPSKNKINGNIMGLKFADFMCNLQIKGKCVGGKSSSFLKFPLI